MNICWNCRRNFEIIVHPFCDICGDPVDGEVDGRFLCHACAERMPEFDRARSAVRYTRVARTTIHALKYYGMIHLARDFACLMEACVRTHFDGTNFDLVTYVPMHMLREMFRGYNQAELLARRLAKLLGGKPVSDCLTRKVRTRKQAGLNARDRRRNVEGSFNVNRPEWIDGRRILLVDDVMTTGATVNECATALKEGGAAQVFVVTAARG